MAAKAARKACLQARVILAKSVALNITKNYLRFKTEKKKTSTFIPQYSSHQLPWDCRLHFVSWRPLVPNRRVSVLPHGECKTAKPENENVIFGILLVCLKNAPTLCLLASEDCSIHTNLFYRKHEKIPLEPLLCCRYFF